MKLIIVSVHQPNYMPWIGFFDKMDKSDVFVILDCPDFNRRGLTHRNRIKTPNGELLLTVPLRVKDRPIHEVLIDDRQPWRHKHFEALNKSYAKSDYWRVHKEPLQQLYDRAYEKLIDLSLPLIRYIRSALGITTEIVLESEMGGPFGTGSERIARICERLGAEVYLSGRGAIAYNDSSVYESYGIRLRYQDFQHPVYRQLWGPFLPNLSVVDLLFNCGPDSLSLIRRYNP